MIIIKKISKEIICTQPLIALNNAYLDWLIKDKIIIIIWLNVVTINWYKIIESTLLKINKFILLIKFIQINNWSIYNIVINKWML